MRPLGIHIVAYVSGLEALSMSCDLQLFTRASVDVIVSGLEALSMSCDRMVELFNCHDHLLWSSRAEGSARCVEHYSQRSGRRFLSQHSYLIHASGLPGKLGTSPLA